MDYAALEIKDGGNAKHAELEAITKTMAKCVAPRSLTPYCTIANEILRQ
jgi:hypothetical protein